MMPQHKGGMNMDDPNAWAKAYMRFKYGNLFDLTKMDQEPMSHDAQMFKAGWQAAVEQIGKALAEAIE